MITTKIYETPDCELVAVVYENGLVQNYVPDAVMAAMDGDSFFEEARLGFPEAFLYDDDFQLRNAIKLAALTEEKLRGCVLLAEVGEAIRLYPRRMSETQREFFALELGDETLADAIARDAGDTGVLLAL